MDFWSALARTSNLKTLLPDGWPGIRYLMSCQEFGANACDLVDFVDDHCEFPGKDTPAFKDGFCCLLLAGHPNSVLRNAYFMARAWDL